jgi:hypothetical protein
MHALNVRFELPRPGLCFCDVLAKLFDVTIAAA